MKSKLLCIAPYSYKPARSGGQRCILEQYRALSQYYDLQVVSTVENQNMEEEPYKFYPLLGSEDSKKRYYSPAIFRSIAELIEAQDIPSLMIEHPYHARFAYRLCSRLGIKFYVRSHNIEFLRFRSYGKIYWPLLKSYERWAYKKADQVLFITDEDKQWAKDNWGIKGSVLRYGTWRDHSRSSEEHIAAHQILCQRHSLEADTSIVLFNGALDYPPNTLATQELLKKIVPQISDNSKTHFILCGKGLNESSRELADALPTVTYAGFVPDIDEYLLGADRFVNPVATGGGIKTKLVEAIAIGLPSVSYMSGAQGIDKQYAGDMLQVVEDYDSRALASVLMQPPRSDSPTPSRFYREFNWSRQVAQLSL